MTGKITVGQKLKEFRVQKRVTLREFAALIGMDAGNYSRVERGVFDPPVRERLDAILEALDVPPAQRTELLDRADVERGQLPTDLMNDETLIRELPILFRAFRLHDDEALDKFIEAVRKDGSKNRSE